MASLYHNKGVELFNNSNYEDAAEFFKKAIKIYPRSYLSHYELANTYSFLNKHKKAVQEYLNALGLKKLSCPSELYRNLAGEYLALGDYKDAYKIINKARQSFPDNEEIRGFKNKISFQYALFLSQKAEERLKQRDFSYAIKLYQDALTVNPNIPTVYLNLATLYLVQDKDKEAREILKRYLRINPKDPWAYNILGDILLGEGLYIDAVKNYKKAIGLNNLLPQAYNGLALAYDYLGYYNSALDMVMKAHKLDPFNESILYNLGKIYRDNSQFQDALNTFLKLKKLNSKFPFTDESLAEIYVLLNEKEKAKAILKKEIAYTTQLYHANKDNASLLKLIYLHFINKDYNVIKNLIQEAERENRDFPELHYFSGRIWEEKGNLISASREYEKAIRSRLGKIARKKYYEIISRQGK